MTKTNVINIDKFVDDVIRAVSKTHDGTAPGGLWFSVSHRIRLDPEPYHDAVKTEILKHLYGDGSSITQGKQRRRRTRGMR
jgi:hypothetical protein